MFLSELLCIIAFATICAVLARHCCIKFVYGSDIPTQKPKKNQRNTMLKKQSFNYLKKIGTFIQPSSQKEESSRLKLAHAGLKIDPITWRGIQIISLLVCLLCSIVLINVFHMQLLSIVITLLINTFFGIFFPLLFLARRKKSREKELTSSLPSALELLSTAVHAGYTIEKGIRLIGTSTNGCLAEEFCRIDKEINYLNMPIEKALQRFKQRCDCNSINNFANALIQANKQGTSVTRALETQASAVRKQYYTNVLVSINQLPNKMVPIIYLIFFPIIITLSVAPVIYNAALQLGNIF